MMDKNEIILSAYICIRRYREGGLLEVGEQVDDLLDAMAKKIAMANGEYVRDVIDDVSATLALERKMLDLETRRLKREIEDKLSIENRYPRRPVDGGIREFFANYDWGHMNDMKNGGEA